MLYHMVFIYCPRKEETSKKHLAVVVKSYLPRLCPEVYCSESFLKCDNPAFYSFLGINKRKILMDCNILEMIWNSIRLGTAWVNMIWRHIFNRIWSTVCGFSYIVGVVDYIQSASLHCWYDHLWSQSNLDKSS